MNTEPVLLRLKKSPEDGDLHVQRHFGVHQGLVLLQLVAQLVQQSLDLLVLRSQLEYRRSTFRMRFRSIYIKKKLPRKGGGVNKGENEGKEGTIKRKLNK